MYRKCQSVFLFCQHCLPLQFHKSPLLLKTYSVMNMILYFFSWNKIPLIWDAKWIMQWITELLFLMQLWLMFRKLLFPNFKNVLTRLVFIFIEYVGLKHVSFSAVLASFSIVTFKYWTVCDIVIEFSFLRASLYMVIIALLSLDWYEKNVWISSTNW